MAKINKIYGIKIACFTILCVLPYLQAFDDIPRDPDQPTSVEDIPNNIPEKDFPSIDTDNDNDPNCEENRQMARRALKQYGQGKLYLNRVEKVVKIGASAPLTIMNFIAFGANPTPIPCQAKFKENDGKETIDVCCLDLILSIEGHRNDKEKISQARGFGLITGGIVDDPNINNPKYTNLAKFAINARDPNLKLTSVTRVRTQAVSGEAYYINFKARKGSTYYVCETSLWERVWIPSLEVTKFECFNDMLKPAFKPINQNQLSGSTLARGLQTGQEVEDNPKDPKYTKFANYAINARDPLLQLIKVIRATRQLVAGWSYKINFTATKGGRFYVCDTTLWEREWIYSLEVTEFKCLPMIISSKLPDIHSNQIRGRICA